MDGRSPRSNDEQEKIMKVGSLLEQEVELVTINATKTHDRGFLSKKKSLFGLRLNHVQSCSGLESWVLNIKFWKKTRLNINFWKKKIFTSGNQRSNTNVQNFFGNYKNGSF